MKVGLDSFFFFGKLSIAVDCKILFVDLACDGSQEYKKTGDNMREVINNIINKVHPEKPLLRIYNFLGSCFYRKTTQKGETLNYNISGWTSFLGVRAFTLIELLVVVLIIGILAAIALPQYQLAVVKSRVGAILPTIRSLADAQEVYYIANGQYATQLSDLDIEVPATCSAVSDSELSYNCGDYSLLEFETDGSVDINYCPGHTTTWNDCKDNRDFQIAFRLRHWRWADGEAGKQLCWVYTPLGNKICASYAGLYEAHVGTGANL